MIQKNVCVGGYLQYSQMVSLMEVLTLVSSTKCLITTEENTCDIGRCKVSLAFEKEMGVDLSLSKLSSEWEFVTKVA